MARRTDRRFLRLALLGSALVVCASGCATITDSRTFAARGAYWRPQLDGDVRVGTSTITGTDIDVEDVLQLGDEETVLYGAELRYGAFGIDASYFALSEDGTSLLQQTISFNGQTYSVGANLDSSVDLNLATAHLRWGWLGIGPLCVGAKLGANYLDVDTRLSDDLSGITVSEARDEVFPVVGGFATFDLGVLGDSLRVIADLDVTGFGGEVKDTEGHFLDAIARVGLQTSALSFGVGYRHLDIALEQSDRNLETDVQLSGPMVYLEIAF
ncbi:MAG: hypothetical protein ACKVX7_07425 [Planctomycetota bacterium]